MLTSVRIGFFLAYRQIRRSTIWTTLLIISIMMLTFLNLIVVNGILIGLIEGSSAALRHQYSGDVLISNLPNRGYIRRSPEIIRYAESLPGVEGITTRYVIGGRAIANYQLIPKGDDLPNQISATIVGIDPVVEDRVTQLSKRVIAGSYLNSNETDVVLVGSSLMQKYTRNQVPGESSLRDVDVGDKIRIVMGSSTEDVVIKGVVKSKIDEVSHRIYFVDKKFRQMIGRADGNVDEIAIVTAPNVAPETITAYLKNTVAGQESLVQTWEESQGSFFKDISTTFRVLGNLIGSIGIIVASITIFIVIFINAVTRKRYIGILKGIGVSGATIEWSYIFQSLFYAIVGSGLGLALLYGFLKPYIDVHPIDFPFSDGILVAETADVFLRIGILLVMTILAGYIPSRIIVRKNTLDSILAANMIRAVDLKKSYRMGEVEQTVLRGVNLQVKPGEFVAIMGKSGAGKSTLLYQLGLLDHPTSGQVFLDGVDTTKLSSNARTQFRLSTLGYVFQDYSLIPELTAAENASLPLLMLGWRTKDAIVAAAEALAAVGLGNKVDRRPPQLSGGEQQRVSIARAIINKPKILFADEPTANLDAETSDGVIEVFKKIHANGQTIVMVTHEEEYGHITDRTIRMKDGLVDGEQHNG